MAALLPRHFALFSLTLLQGICFCDPEFVNITLCVERILIVVVVEIGLDTTTCFYYMHV